MIEDDEEADSGPMPLLVDCLLADLNARHEAQQQVLAQSRAVSKQMDDALQAQMLRMARAVEERRKARDKYEADWAVASALSLLAKIERTTSVEANSRMMASQQAHMFFPGAGGSPPGTRRRGWRGWRTGGWTVVGW